VRFSAVQIADAVGGSVVGPDLTVNGASIDSREVSGGELFVPIVAERDGHDFIAAALAAGAAAYLTSRPADEGGTAIVVDDTAAAFARLGSAARDRLPDRVVGITGSVGKTSTKDLLASVLSQRWVTGASPQSFNNELGVPLTLVNAPERCEALVVEMGARGRGHIASLCEVARPSVGVVTAVAAVHTELFGTIDDVAVAKRELVEALPASGTAVLNALDERVRAMATHCSGRVLTFGGVRADVRADDLTLDDELRPSFTLVTPWGSTAVTLSVRGAHQVANVLAAAAAGLACDVPLDEVAAGLASARLSRWRMELTRAPSGVLVLNDAYNANPTSVAAALESLAALDARRRVAVLGVMAELGPESDDEHARIGKLAGELGVEVITVDAPAYGIATDVAGVDAALDALARLELRQGDAVLVKGSRVAGLERVAAALTGTRSESA
jgi:UDP-N-acetylmuramoyl-tripeptide--D-alanyl-D-alanine ligase